MNKKELLKFISENKSNYSIQLKRHHKSVYDSINELKGNSFAEKLYRFIYGDEESHCIICGSECKFDGFNKGFRKTCSYQCHADDRKRKAREMRKCVVCGKEFEVHKKRQKACCSMECFNEYILRDEIKEKRNETLKNSMIEKYGVDRYSKHKDFKKKLKETKKKRHGNENYVNPTKGKLTKLKKYGDENYVNPEKIKNTMLKKYGVNNAFHLPQAQTAGKRISKFQRRIYEQIKVIHKDALLEHYLPDIQKSVDIYVPSTNTIIECFGDYWHMNPSCYDSDDYNNNVHKTAQEIWDTDKQRIDEMKSAGYKTKIVWES